jgi:hypothetical protein
MEQGKWGWVSLACGSWLLICGCAPKPPPAAPVAQGPKRSTEMTLEACEGGAEVLHDADGDGTPEIRAHMEAGRETCRIVDLNGDGSVETTVFFDNAGGLRRVQSDFDRDRRVDEVAFYQNGVIHERWRAAQLTGRVDTWEYYENGRIVRTERDQNGDSITDQWWEYPHPECPLIHSDADGDGRPDPQTTVDYCKATGFVPPSLDAANKPGLRAFEAKKPGEDGISEVREVRPTGQPPAQAGQPEADLDAGDPPPPPAQEEPK